MSNAAVNAILEITNRVLRITRTLLCYRSLQYFCFPLIVVYFLQRLLSQRDYWSHFGERLGFLPQLFRRTSAGAIWLHAVSVGEVASAVPLLRDLRIHAPGVPLFLSTSTVAGRHMAERQALPWVDGIFYAPVDYAWCVRRVLRSLRPGVLVVFETEIWPNLFAETKKTGAQLVLANARISDRTWPRYQGFRWFFLPLLQLADIVFAQSLSDGERYRTLGVADARLHVAGNLKYDAMPESAKSVALHTGGAQRVWIAASTVGPNERGSLTKHSIDEDDLVLDIFAELSTKRPGLLLILAPRQPQRFEIVAQKLRERNIPFIRRTEMQGDRLLTPPVPGILLLDTVGELARCYAWADVVFVGGSIAPRGGHNILEPAAVGAAIVVGPYMQNFQAIAADFLAASAMLQVQNTEQLRETVEHLLTSPAVAQALGTRAKQLVESRRGVASHLALEIAKRQSQAFLSEPRSLTGAAFLRFWSRVWTAGGVRKRLRGESFARTREPLPVPVISIGGITIGGSGKTPFCIHLARELRQQGYTPAILTRGYRRRSPAKVIFLPPGANVPAHLTGDEAQIFLRSGQASVGIGGDRYQAACLLLQHAPETDVLLLDDGYQHARLPRDIDIVLIDGLDPFGGAGVVPLGRLREPLSALRRADIFVVTRAPDRARFEAIRERLAEWNANAPVFAATLQAHRWQRCAGSFTSLLPATRVGAFCGLGNPANFWKTLNLLGLDLVFEWSFGDHHLYKPTDLKRLAALAREREIEVLVTTEKDSINLPPDAETLLGGIALAWLPIELKLDEPALFFSYLEKTLLPHRVRK